MATGGMICLADPSKNQTISFKFLESAEKLTAYHSDKITSAYYIVSNYAEATYTKGYYIYHEIKTYDSELIRVDLDTFERRKVYVFPETSKGYSFQIANEYFTSSRANILEKTVTPTGVIYGYCNFDVEKEKIEEHEYEENVWDYRRTVYEDEKYEFFLTARKSFAIYTGTGNKLILNRYNKVNRRTDVMHHADIGDTNVGYAPDAVRYY